MRTTSDNALADEIIEIGRKCVANGVEKVFISGLVICERVDKTRVSNINKILESKCVELDFIFIKNENIYSEHIWKDGIHLSDKGKDILSINYINTLNSFLYMNTYIPLQT